MTKRDSHTSFAVDGVGGVTYDGVRDITGQRGGRGMGRGGVTWWMNEARRVWGHR